jgi:hypothetical protein
MFLLLVEEHLIQKLTQVAHMHALEAGEQTIENIGKGILSIQLQKIERARNSKKLDDEIEQNELIAQIGSCLIFSSFAEKL